MNANLVLTLMIALLGRTQVLATILQNAKAEGRDVTDAEVDSAFAGDDVARAEFQKLIDDARKGPQ